jgi:hypothetical protein
LQDIAHGDVVGYEFSDIDVWSQPPPSEDFLDDSSLDSAANSSVPIEVRMCNGMSWWQRAALARSKAADGRAAAAAAAAAPAQTTRASQQQQKQQQQSGQVSADTARAIAADLQQRIDELEREKVTSMRSIDDIDADIDVLNSKLDSVQKAGKRRRFWLF